VRYFKIASIVQAIRLFEHAMNYFLHQPCQIWQGDTTSKILNVPCNDTNDKPCVIHPLKKRYYINNYDSLWIIIL